MHQVIESRLSSAINRSDASSIGAIWDVFKTEFSNLSTEEGTDIVDLGIQAELYEGSEFGPPCFYFAFHYQIESEEEGEKCSHYELVYCEFDLSDNNALNEIENAVLDLWLSEYEEGGIFKRIEEWGAFKSLRNELPKLNVYGTEV